MPLFDYVTSTDVEHLDRPGGHIGLMAGSKARKEIWPEIAGWLAERSDQSADDHPLPTGSTGNSTPHAANDLQEVS
jgi:hypothetical protein